VWERIFMADGNGPKIIPVDDKRQLRKEVIRNKFVEQRNQKLNSKLPLKDEPREIKPINLSKPVRLVKVIKVVEFLKLAGLILDKDSPHGMQKEAEWASAQIEDKIRRMKDLYDITVKAKGLDDPGAASLKKGIDFLEAAYAATLSAAAPLKKDQYFYKTLFDGIDAKTQEKKKAREFFDKIVSNLFVPGATFLGGLGVKISKLWDMGVDYVKSLVPPKNQLAVEIVEYAINGIGLVFGGGAIYYLRKWWATKADNAKKQIEGQAKTEKDALDKERRQMVDKSYDNLSKVIMELCATNESCEMPGEKKQ